MKYDLIIQIVVNICTLFVIFNWLDDSFGLITNIVLVVGGLFLLIETFLIYSKGMGGSIICKKPLPYRILRVVVYIVDIIVYGRLFFWFLKWWDVFWKHGRFTHRLSWIMICASFIMSIWGCVLFIGVSFKIMIHD